MYPLEPSVYLRGMARQLHELLTMAILKAILRPLLLSPGFQMGRIENQKSA